VIALARLRTCALAHVGGGRGYAPEATDLGLTGKHGMIGCRVVEGTRHATVAEQRGNLAARVKSQLLKHGHLLRVTEGRPQNPSQPLNV
jgi:hypothetical protein